MPRTPTLLLILTLCASARAADHAPVPEFDRIVIDDDLPGAYQVEVADVNGDKKPDIVALGGSTVAWYENPTWKKRIITDKATTPGVISTATRDLDGDGRAEVAIGYDFEMNQPKRGELLIATQGETLDDPWITRHLGHFGSIHRLRWGDFDNDGLTDLILAPIFGESAKPPTYDQEPATLLCLRTTEPIKKARDWKWDRMPLMKRPVIHAIEVLEPIDREPITDGLPAPKTQVLSASNLGVASVLRDPKMAIGDEAPLISATMFPGAEGPPPARGSSEIHLGRFRTPEGASDHFYATIEPWHGTQVVIWQALHVPGDDISHYGKKVRTVLDDTLDGGHALWVADVDHDGDDEIFAGHRGKDHRVSIYNFDGKSWTRTVLDRDIAAQDFRGGDLDGDGTPDVVGVGGSTHNVVWYRPKKPEN